MLESTSLTVRAEKSEWLGTNPELTAAVQGWERHLTDERATLAAHAARLARPGAVPVVRVVRHQAALVRAQLASVVQRLPGLVTGGVFDAIRDPRAQVQVALVRLTREYLARLGPSTAEIARLLEESAGLAPDSLVSELRERPIEIAPVGRGSVLDSLSGLVREQIADLGPVTAVRPISQAHAARLHDGSSVTLHVRRPGAAREVRQDTRIFATALAALELAVPAARVAHPRGLLEVITLQMLEENDLRNEALNAIELGLAVEQLGLESIIVARPLPLLVAPEAAGFESFAHSQRLAELPVGSLRPEALGELARLVAESAFLLGIFPADLHRDRFTALPDGRLVVTGCSTIGRLDADLRRGTLDLLVAMMGGDIAGQVAALVTMGAVPGDADLAGLETDLGAIPQPDMFMLLSGMAAPFDSFNEVMDMAVRHHLRPPVELMLFARTLLALKAMAERVEPATAFTGLLMPLAFKLPELRAALD